MQGSREGAELATRTTGEIRPLADAGSAEAAALLSGILLTAPLPEGRGFLAQAASGSSAPGGLTPSTPAGFRPARTSITRAEFLSLGETAPHAVQV
jgi:hypothetical protein